MLPSLTVFGEVLFDCFPSGEKILGGAPFNVAWHLRAFGNDPVFVSRIGRDREGALVEGVMRDWGLSAAQLQSDLQHPTGRVEVSFQDREPQYEIVPDSAFDFIAADQLSAAPTAGILYHGTLALRNQTSRRALEQLSADQGIKIFLDVNLRPPWWQLDEVKARMERATWVKMNQDELTQLGPGSGDLHQDMSELVRRFALDQLVVTRGAQGAVVLTSTAQFHTLKPQTAVDPIDTVGAGDAFSAVYLHGLIHGWPLEPLLDKAQQFANMILAIRGATSSEQTFYREFVDSLSAIDTTL